MQLPKGKKFYGSVTVSERGQIVIPAEARRDFGIEVGDKLLVVGDLKRGIALAKASVLTGMMAEMLEMFYSAPEADEAGEGGPA
jgi:AbrB family looped-hinge helix DNA binding protein